jgi:23S rRNA pseudouridine1911/1915/1917 synthase
MIVAKTDAAHRTLARALSHRRIGRVYAVLVWGHVDDRVTVDAPVGRHPRDRKRMIVRATGRQATTHLTRVARFETCDLVRAQLETGRTHQIRVHCAHIGHPVVGDPVYGGGGARRVSGASRRVADAVERAVPRQALHASRLEFRHPRTRETVRVASDWPGDLRPALAAAAGESDLLDRGEVLAYLGFDDGAT